MRSENASQTRKMVLGGPPFHSELSFFQQDGLVQVLSDASRWPADLPQSNLLTALDNGVRAPIVREWSDVFCFEAMITSVRVRPYYSTCS